MAIDFYSIGTTLGIGTTGFSLLSKDQGNRDNGRALGITTTVLSATATAGSSLNAKQSAEMYEKYQKAQVAVEAMRDLPAAVDEIDRMLAELEGPGTVEEQTQQEETPKAYTRV